MAKRKVPPADTRLADFRESAGLTPPPRTLSNAASRLVDLMDEFLYSLQCGWEIPPGFPRDRFVPTVYGKRDLVVPIVQYLDDFGFTGDARRLHEATRRFYAHQNWKLMTPSPGDDKGWKEFQERYVKPLGHELAILQGRICDVRQLIIDAAAREVVAKLAAKQESTNRSPALTEVGSASQGDDEGETIKPTGTKESTRPGEANEPQSLLTVESWSELAIGVGEDGYWALGHVPDVGSVFPKESAVELDLPGDRWKNVLKLLANSPDGQSALKRDLFIELGYLSSAVKDEDLDDLRHDDGAITKIKSASKRLTQAMGDLSRGLRGLVSAKDTKKRVAQISTSGGHVRSLFTCRHLFRGADGKLRFGSGE